MTNNFAVQGNSAKAGREQAVSLMVNKASKIKVSWEHVPPPPPFLGGAHVNISTKGMKFERTSNLGLPKVYFTIIP